MFESQVQGRQSGRRVPRSSKLGDGSSQYQLVGAGVHSSLTDQAWNSACWALRASSRSTVFIMEDGPVSAFFLTTVR